MRISKQTTHLTLTLTLALSGLLLLPACEEFGFDDGGDDDFGESGSGSGEGTTGEEEPPSVGFRVYPQYLTQDVTAVVTVEGDGVVPEACELDGDPSGGYVCDAGEVVGSTVTIRVEREGFEAAVRMPEIQPGQIFPLVVHLNIEGFVPGSWSMCAPIGTFETCYDMCNNELRVCQAGGCETGDPDWPIATAAYYAKPDCSDLKPVETPVLLCEDELPLEPGEINAIACCCEG